MPSWPMAMPSSTAMVLNSGDAARPLDLARHELAEVLEVHVPRDELGEGVGDRDDRLAEIPSVMPVARHRARAPAMLRPCVVVRER